MKKLALSLLLAAAVVSATPVAQVKFVGIPANAPTLGSPKVIVSPYTLSINGSNYAALCIDFNDESSVGSTWNAYVSQVGADIGNTYNPGSALQYKEAAWIYNQITAPGTSAQTKIDLQEAAWYIMDPNYASGKKAQYGPDTAAMTFVTAAQNNYNSVNLANFEIISAVTAHSQQEFLIATPEPASCALFGVAFLLAGALRFSRKRQQTAIVTESQTA